MRIFLILMFSFLLIGCGRDAATVAIIERPEAESAAEPAKSSEGDETPEDKPEYPGVTIDQAFPIIGHISSIDENGAEPEAAFVAEGFLVKIKQYIPQTLEREGEIVFRFKPREPGGYHGALVGLSHLRGADTREIYVAASGPGAVCCTNYSITDVSADAPKSIYHSEDFGHFRGAMEIFDAEGDGIYELMQWDSCFRYFMDDCGSCSPQPRAYFKYDKSSNQYVPAAGIMQDFVRAGFDDSDRWLAEKYAELQLTDGDLAIDLDLYRSALSHTVDLLYVGEEKRAWDVFDKYVVIAKAETRREVKKRLAQCKFYQAIMRANR